LIFGLRVKADHDLFIGFSLATGLTACAHDTHRGQCRDA
jgi:hypothetical protein